MSKKFLSLFLGLLSLASHSYSDNQTATLSPIFPPESLPYRILVEEADFSLPNGLQSFVAATYKNKWVFLAGRTNGMHSFNNDTNNFPPARQNDVVYVVDLVTKTTTFKSLNNPSSQLTQHQIDLLSVTSPQFYQHDDYLYISGGYGVDTESGLFSTKDCFTSIYIPGLIRWVEDTGTTESASQYIQQIFDPFFQVTGGNMYRVSHHLSLLIFGQNFRGYYLPDSNGNYTNQVRRFRVLDNNPLKVELKDPKQLPEEIYRRRDLNVVPIIQRHYGWDEPSFVAFSGVFTMSGGAWTVPVVIDSKGKAYMADPSEEDTFKQGMNNYACANAGLYSAKHKYMYTLLFGGITYGYFQNGEFLTDYELPFTNQITTIRMNKNWEFKQYIMDAEYPVIISTGSNPGNPLLFGAGAKFLVSNNLDTYSNQVIKLDKIDKPVTLGYIVGGIQSTVPNTSTASDSAASPYIFKVILIPK